jgi:ligand-binding SRPBCC domain-containing protein
MEYNICLCVLPSETNGGWIHNYMSKEYNFKTEMIIPDNLDNVFSFFSAAENLQAITPPWLHFRILTPTPLKIEPGHIIDYKLSLYGFPFKWKTRITLWDPPNQFIDEQIRGPYRKWVHHHLFEPRGDHTCMRDQVTYEIPVFSEVINNLFVNRNVTRIFNFRRRRINELFSRSP